MKSSRMVAAALLIALVFVSPARVAPVAAERPGKTDHAPFFTGIGDPGSFKAAMDARLTEAQQQLDRLLAVKGPRTVANTLQPYDDSSIAFAAVTGPANLIAAVHPDEKMRHVAEEALQRARTAVAEVPMNRALYEAIAAIDLRKADAETRYYVQRELRNFRLNGVDKDEATRARLAQLQNDLAGVAQEFLRNTRTMRSFTVSSAAELDGLPPDFIARHKPDAHGAITLGTADSDARPVLTFARKEDVRKRMYFEWTNVAYPVNLEVLDRMIAIRTEIARLMGYESWAAYDMADRMSGTVTVASDFIDRAFAASRSRAARDYDEMLARKKLDVPDATGVPAWDNYYYAELVKKANYDFDAQAMRPYFPYERVQQGVFDIISKLYDVRFRPAKDAPVWHPSVQAYEMLENGAVTGRFYLDMHPRPNKLTTGGATSTVRYGVGGRQIPEVVIVASLPGGQPGDPGLLTHDDVRGIIFHEFGHLVQAMMAGRHRWIGVTRVGERDFLEAPSQMFEEWAWDPSTLATFARHYQTNEPVPAALVQRLRRASEFGKGLYVAQQMFLAKLSLALHDRDPKTIDSTAILRDLQNKYLPFAYVEGTHRHASLGHLSNRNYSASYYTYMWSLMIVKDFLSQFDSSNFLSPTVARRYRETVLAPGGSKPASALVQDFLGRPFSASAWERWLNYDPS